MIACGGGVIGDLGGFVAATYMRGVPFVQVPTSLLAMTDSSIGGKTGIDVPLGKNLVGAFMQPRAVYTDLSFLQTLPLRELCNGMAEVIKHGIIRSRELFEWCEARADAVMRRDIDALRDIVSLSQAIKVRVVNEDEKEAGLRSILNFGHTIGHGIEAHMQPNLLHGECVAIGMVKEAEVARALGLCPPRVVGRIIRCLKLYKLPTRMPEGLPVEKIMHRMQFDKKNVSGQIKCVLVKDIGEVVEKPYTTTIDPKLLSRVMSGGVVLRAPSPPSGQSVRVPGSKSVSNRALLLAAVGEGECRLTGLLHSDDTQVMMSALQNLGAGFRWEGEALVVTGNGGKLKALHGESLYLSNAGTATRFLTTLCTLMGAFDEHGMEDDIGWCELTGSERMLVRPIGPLVDALNDHGCKIEYLGEKGFLPLKILGGYPLGTGDFYIEGKVSSQFVSSVLLSAPIAAARTKEPLTLHLAEQKPTSVSYILMTIELMKRFGARVERLAANKFKVLPPEDGAPP